MVLHIALPTSRHLRIPDGRKKEMFQLEKDEGTIVGHENLELYITEYYKKLFGAPVDNCVSMDEQLVG